MKTISKIKETLARRKQVRKHFDAIKHLDNRLLEDIGLDAGRVHMGIKAYPWK